MKYRLKPNSSVNGTDLSSTIELKGKRKMKGVQQIPKSDRKFEQLLLEAIDEELSSLGDVVKKGIYGYLEKKYHIKIRDIACRIDEFTDAIEEIFGLAAKFLEIGMMKRLYRKIGDNKYYPWERTDLVFVEYLKAAETAETL